MTRVVLLFGVLLVLTAAALGAQSGVNSGVNSGQETGKGPITKYELLSLIKQRGPNRVPQGDIADMVAERGLAFSVDDEFLQEMRAAGAEDFLIESIKHSAEQAAMPRLHRRTSDDAGGPVLTPEEIKREEEEEIARLPFLEQARVHAMDFAKELPNFVVSQKVTRYLREPQTRGDWIVDDKLEIEETYRIDKGEELKLVSVNGKPTSRSYEQLGGAISSGEFGASLASLFAPESHTQFTEIRHEQFRGRDTVLYDFKVLKAHSTLTITDRTSGQSIISGYTGSAWIDSETKRVLRLEESADPPPPGFPITLSESAVEYDWVDISGQKYFLPVHAEVLLGRDADRYYGKNVIDFVNYHKFEGEIKVEPGD